ncbi:P-loop NTPase fold protein [Chryseobacterium terrae]|uniref:P-loop NTPase fold protein n=1 Tax=Chryseobacterium terrae TaxID=3163299 RepID=A0ABW8Y3T6_9FLAO
MGRELIEKVFQKFENHLNVENNNRVVFSGKFGIGKSYFLNEFFNDEKYEKEYFPIFINPVNYSIASNEDIFELIKFDILFQILSRDVIVFDKLNFPKGNLIHQYFTTKFLDDFISASDLIGENIVEENASGSFGILKNLGKLLAKLSELSKRDFQKFEDEIQKNPELEIINSFFKQQESKIGSFYENNAITQLIYKLIKNIEEQSKKKMTLVIDDLDRIDPEHIFRILNIFSAHDKLGENKFGFEKVILVCDINNIKHIYHHFYGKNVDFFGYINKFYSSEVYEYSNKNYVKYFEEDFKFNSFSDPEHLQFIKFIIANGISENIITARQLFNLDFSKNGISEYFNSFWRANNQVIYKYKTIYHFHYYNEGFAIISTLLNYFGNEELLLKIIVKQDSQQLLNFKNSFLKLYEFLVFYKEKKEDEGLSFQDEDLNLTYQVINGIIEFKSVSSLDVEKFYKNLIKKHNEIIN